MVQKGHYFQCWAEYGCVCKSSSEDLFFHANGIAEHGGMNLFS
jgi:hypothetical protein